MSEKETKNKKSLETQYFEEARSWDKGMNDLLKKSNKRAWIVAFCFGTVAVLEACVLIIMMPLKTIEPFIIRVDNNTGYTDVISKLAQTDGKTEIASQEALDKFFLGQYIRHREGYQWTIRDYDRNLIGLMSDSFTQQQYADYTDNRNPQAPINLYRDKIEVKTTIKAVSFIGKKEIKEQSYTTALVRYTKQTIQKGERPVLTHWVATVTYTYINASMSVEDRQLNPLGFQVTSYRNDQETAGAGNE